MECSEFAKSYLSDSHKKILLDVRETEEVASGKLVEAVNIPLSSLEERANEIAKDAHIYIYCRSGRRALTARDILAALGHSQVFTAANGGFEELSCLMK